MKMARRIIEVTIDSVKLNIKGSRKGHKHVLGARLVYPRPGIAEKLALQPIAVTKGEAKLAKAKWPERILFKEVVQGPFGLGIEVSRAMSESEMGKVIEAMASSVIKVAGKEIAEVAGGPWGGALMGLPLKFLSGLISKKGSSDSVGAGVIELCADSKWPSSKVKKLTIPLVADENVYEMRRTRQGNSIRMIRKRVIKKADQSGSVVVKLRLYD